MRLYVTNSKADGAKYVSLVQECLRVLLEGVVADGNVKLTPLLVLAVLRQMRRPIVAEDVSLAFHVLVNSRTISEDPCDAILVLVSVSHDLTHGSKAEVHRYEIRLASRQEGQAVTA
jgi:hypothetical protein